jgi:hypothetical protein
MWRATTVALVAAMLLALSMGAALALDINCTGGFCEGTDEDDTMNGTDQTDEMFARGGNDKLNAADGNDSAFGGPGDDWFFGGADNGSDQLHGEEGEDTFGGDPQNIGQAIDPGTDTYTGGPGKDEIWAREGWFGEPEFADTVDCGEGNEDLAVFDETHDSVQNCERLDWTKE